MRNDLKAGMENFKDTIWEIVENAESIGIAGHVRPDGDCIGSVTSLFLYLKKVFPQKRVAAYAEFVPEEFQFLKGSSELLGEEKFKETEKYDVFVSLDCGAAERLGNAEKLFTQASTTVNIDHHVSNELFADHNYVQGEKSSTSEVLFSLLDEKWMDKEIAEALYLGIIHDTGVFRHSNTSPETLAIAGKLIGYGIPFSRMIDETFYQKTFKQNQILGSCLLRSRLHLGGKVISSYIDRETMQREQAVSSDLDGIVDQLRITKGVQAAIFLHELEDGKITEAYRKYIGKLPVYKVSMRVNDVVDVSRIAVLYGGGGHKKAAGCTMAGTHEEIIKKLLEEIKKQL